MSRRSAGPRSVRRVAYAGLTCTLVAAIVVLLESVMDDAPGPRLPGLWWTSVALLLTVQVLAARFAARVARTAPPALLTPLVCLAMTAFLLHPDHGLTGAFVVVSAAWVALLAPTRVAVTVIALQTAAASAGLALVGSPLVDVLAGLVVFAGFQAFGALVVRAARNEAEARDEVARTHAELRSAVSLLELASRDAERVRIARDLHDVVGHQLTALALELEVATHLLGDGPATAHVSRARTVAKDLLENVRSAVGEMRADQPPALEPMLRKLARDAPGISVSVRVTETVPVDAAQAHAILRWAQEAVTNTLRHADATRIALTVDSGESGVHVRASDDGEGTATVVAGHGLTGMRERLEALGGSLEVRSAPGTGFTVDGRLPRTGTTT